MHYNPAYAHHVCVVSDDPPVVILVLSCRLSILILNDSCEAGLVPSEKYHHPQGISTITIALNLQRSKDTTTTGW